MLKEGAKGIGGSVATITLGAISAQLASEFARLICAYGGVLVLFWTIWQLNSLRLRNNAERATAEESARKIRVEAAQKMAELCEQCREKRIPPDFCPIPKEQRPPDCPHKDRP